MEKIVGEMYEGTSSFKTDSKSSIDLSEDKEAEKDVVNYI